MQENESISEENLPKLMALEVVEAHLGPRRKAAVGARTRGAAEEAEVLRQEEEAVEVVVECRCAQGEEGEEEEEEVGGDSHQVEVEEEVVEEAPLGVVRVVLQLKRWKKQGAREKGKEAEEAEQSLDLPLQLFDSIFLLLRLGLGLLPCAELLIKLQEKRHE
ncbi:hypothetical protein EYF80_018504 [Liparis tanakae]|uniref:Uncharacterized protein n=1 Tax=Liparis tanakae TaxID=230148 RepID=A0A4Z2I248_9TELE|nr:hypothetical protein EYF80_018504 [Liparis tanakae]